MEKSDQTLHSNIPKCSFLSVILLDADDLVPVINPKALDVVAVPIANRYLYLQDIQNI